MNTQVFDLSSKNKVILPYDPQEFPRESSRHYISADKSDLSEMLISLNLTNLSDLFEQIPQPLKFESELDLPVELSYEQTCSTIQGISEKSNIFNSLIGDMLPRWSVDTTTEFVSKLRPLSTSYTPYQPERSQGTLITHWIYQCAMSALTGFEAINTSLYDRSFALYEAIACAIRTTRRTKEILLAETLFPDEIDVLRTLTRETGIKFTFVEMDPETGLIDLEKLDSLTKTKTDLFSAFAFPQVNSLGLLEDVDALSNFCTDRGIRSIATIDPILLASGGLKIPTKFGRNGVDFIVGDAQHLAIPPSFGGPGLGLFGCRYNENNKKDLRNSPGRYVGKAKDVNDRDCFVMVLSTREQHIRKEKATSNVCSNQAFLATLAGANLLARGDKGLQESLKVAVMHKQKFWSAINELPGIELAFPNSCSFNELVLRTDRNVSDLLTSARKAGIHLGVDVSDRIRSNDELNLIKLTFTDIHKVDEIDRIINFLNNEFSSKSCTGEYNELADIPTRLLRKDSPNLPSFSHDEVNNYYERLAELNVSPDNGCYPLGSCTMKYNPLLNDWAAGLPGFSNAHPQAPLEDVQGPLAVLFEIQEWFKKVTGLAGVTTQPVAGAQGELVGLKLFQAYHRFHEEPNRDVVFIPRSAHGTNFATAAMAGYPDGIVYLQANSEGTIDTQDFESKLQKYGDRLCGVMITNPNTSGIFESNFRDIAEKVHNAGGLVYMDGANMNAIAGIVNLNALGVDAVHNNLHKTWTIPHGGGGPGDAIVAVSEKLVDFLPGKQVVQDENGKLSAFVPNKSIGSFHRHWGNFGHKVRALSYLLRLGKEGIPKMSSTAVLSSRYLFEKLRKYYLTLPVNAQDSPRMHEFILTLSEDEFVHLENAGIPKSQAIPQIGKLFLDFGFHAPTVAFPEVYGLMIEPTESYTKSELDRFAEAVLAIKEIIMESPGVLKTAPHFTPIDRVDEVSANRSLQIREPVSHLPHLPFNRVKASDLMDLKISEIKDRILESSNAH